MRILLSNSSDVPIYVQIVEQIRRQVLNDELKSGDSLPSIRILARDLHISVITTKRAYEELEHAGFIHTVPGKGSFIADQNPALLREHRLAIVEAKLTEALDEARLLGLSLEEISTLLNTLAEES
jgi:GntR family transcriptional regulator